MLMPFGKHKGVAISELPDLYLEWLYYDAEIRTERLRNAIAEELCDRGLLEDEDDSHSAPTGPLSLTSDERDIVKAGIRALTLRNHPDQGGSTEAMTRINLAAASLRKKLGVV